MTPHWLPPLVHAHDYENNWTKYVRALYQFFQSDFILNNPNFRGSQVRLDNRPLDQGKHPTFWHITHTGPTEEKRIPDSKRCKRIRWPKPIIENSMEDTINVWVEPRYPRARVHLWFSLQDVQEDYLVVLEDYQRYLILITAFPVEKSHYKKGLQKRYQQYQTS